MSKSPNEVVYEFILKKNEREHDKYVSGVKSNWLAWSDYITEFRAKNWTIESQQEEIEMYRRFIKEMGYEAVFRKWRG